MCVFICFILLSIISSGSIYCCLVMKSYPTLCNSMDSSPTCSSVHGVSQATILDWVAIFSRGSSWIRDWTQVSCIGRRFLYHWATRRAPESISVAVNGRISFMKWIYGWVISQCVCVCMYNPFICWWTLRLLLGVFIKWDVGDSGQVGQYDIEDIDHLYFPLVFPGLAKCLVQLAAIIPLTPFPEKYTGIL